MDPTSSPITLFPDFDVHVGSAGVTATAGVRGAAHALSGAHAAQRPPPAPGRTAPLRLRPYADRADGAIQSAHLEVLGSPALRPLGEAVLRAHRQRALLGAERSAIERRLRTARERQAAYRARSWSAASQDEAAALEQAAFDEEVLLLASTEALRETAVHVEVTLEPELAAAYDVACQAFDALRRSAGLWDVTRRAAPRQEAPPVDREVERRPVRFDWAHLPVLDAGHPAMHLENANGADLYLYPTFCVVRAGADACRFIDLAQVRLTYEPVDFFELAPLPADARVVRWTWQHVTAEGQPEPRAAENREVPVAAYADLHLRSLSGLNELFLCSNRPAARTFFQTFAVYLDLLASLPKGVGQQATDEG